MTLTLLESNYEAATHLFGAGTTTWVIYLLVYLCTMLFARSFCRGQVRAVAAFALTPVGILLSSVCALPFLLVAALGLLRALVCGLVTIECVRTHAAAGTSAFRRRDEDEDSRER